ncbi:MAG: DUF853 domain-containing protein [Nitrospinota bacterium]|nr:DUF853 domain-containing protein [Nitrospinota bacterium]
MTEKLMAIGGADGKTAYFNASMAVRHGMIAGATGTGKTITLQTIAESFSRMGVPVFMSDVKGDLSGLASPGSENPKIADRLGKMGLSGFKGSPCPVLFWDLDGKMGHPVRTTISEMGPLLLATALDLSEAQTGVLYTCFKVADDNGFLLLDIKDLRALLKYVSDNSKEIAEEYGLVSTASVGAIGRQLLILEEQGAEAFFGEPAISISDFMIRDFSGQGVINILDVTKLVASAPRLYAIFLLWFLSELFENLPEAGEVELPKLVFFFDEAHLLFDQAPKTLLDKIEQVVRLIRSKGVGVFFVSQSPLDIPEDVMGQLGMKVLHALRAFTPKDKKTIKAVAESFPPNPGLDVESSITELGVGEALVSSLDSAGRPTPAQRIFIKPPESKMGPLSPEERAERISRSPLKGKYDTPVDRESAYEKLKKAAEDRAKEAEEQAKAAEQAKEAAEQAKAAEREAAQAARGSGRQRQSVGEAMMKSAGRAVASQVATQVSRQVAKQLGGQLTGKLGGSIVRGVLGSILGGFRR